MEGRKKIKTNYGIVLKNQPKSVVGKNPE